MTRVLVIDDDPSMLLMCRSVLQSDRHFVLEASDGASGLARAQTDHPSLIMLDLMMPTMDGFEVLAELAQNDRTKHVPVIVLTAKARKEDQIRSWQAGASGFVLKPFPPEQLLNAVTRVMAMTPFEREHHRKMALKELMSKDP